MSHSHEPSYYEIALTNRQVLVVFVVLLVCVVAAFFSGVWIGRQDGEVAIAEVAKVLEEEPNAEGETDGVGELNFFSEQSDEDKPSLSEVAEEPQVGTTLAQDIGVEEPVETAEMDGPSSDTTPEPVAPAQEKQETPEIAAKPPTKEPVSAPTAAGEHVIQVFSSADEDQAKLLISKLSGGGFPAFLSPVEVGGQTMYRVRIGPYAELGDAETVAARVRRTYKLDTWVTR